MRRIIREKVVAVITNVDNKENIILSVGFATFFFGFALGALLNLYLILTHSQLFLGLRTALTFKSTIFGDGIILPIVNMIAVSFLLKESRRVTKRVLHLAILLGIVVTLYFHVNQAVLGLVNWAMPAPWHWNALGAFHALYMLSVACLLSLFYVVGAKIVKKEKRLPKEVIIASVGVLIFFLLLRLDYFSVSLSSIFPGV